MLFLSRQVDNMPSGSLSTCRQKRQLIYVVTDFAHALFPAARIRAGQRPYWATAADAPSRPHERASLTFSKVIGNRHADP